VGGGVVMKWVGAAWRGPDGEGEKLKYKGSCL